MERRAAQFQPAGQVAGGWPFILSGLKTLIETGQQLMPAPAEEHVHA